MSPGRRIRGLIVSQYQFLGTVWFCLWQWKWQVLPSNPPEGGPERWQLRTAAHSAISVPPPPPSYTVAGVPAPKSNSRRPKPAVYQFTSPREPRVQLAEPWPGHHAEFPAQGRVPGLIWLWIRRAEDPILAAKEVCYVELLPPQKWI